MNEKYKYLLKNTGLLTISNFSSKILSFLLVPIYTSKLTTTEFGNYDLVMTTMSILFPILSANIADGVMRFSMQFKNDKSSYYKTIEIGLYHTAIACLIFALLLVINYVFSVWKFIRDYSLLIFLFFSFYMFYQLENNIAKSEEKVLDMAIAGFIGTISVVSLNILFLVVYNFHLKGYFVANIIGQALSALFLICRVNRRVPEIRKIDRRLQREMLMYTIPLILTSVGWWVNSASDRYIVTYFCGVEVNGIYSISYKIPSIISVIQTIFIQAWQISAIKESEDKNYYLFYRNIYAYMNFLMAITCSFLIAGARLLGLFLYANDFYEAWMFTPFLLLSSVINTASGFCGAILAVKKDSRTMARSAIWGIVINIILNVILVIPLGAEGAAIATAISSYIIFGVRVRKVSSWCGRTNLIYSHLSWIILIFQGILVIITDNYLIQGSCITLLLLLYHRQIGNLFNKWRKE